MFSSLQPAFTEQFLHHERLIKVQLVDSKLIVMDEYSRHEITLNFGAYFSTELDSYGNMASISVFAERVVHLAHLNPTVLEQWASLLHRNIHKVGFHKDYAMLEKIGEGLSAKVYLARAERGGHKVAVKAICKKKMEKKDVIALQNQIKILRLIDSHYFPKLLGTYSTQHTFYLVLDYASGQTLKEVIEEFNVDYHEKREILMKIAYALKYLHQRQIVHRDIKPENIIYNIKTKEIKIIDLGFSIYLPQKCTAYTNCGTPGYVAPQTFNKDYEPNTINDVFSLGMLAHFVFTRKLPFRQRGRSILLESRDYKFSLSNQLKKSPSLLYVLKKMICHQSERININQFLCSNFASENISSPINPQMKPITKKTQNLSALNERAQSLCFRERGCSVKLKNHKMYQPPYKRANVRMITDRF